MSAALALVSSSLAIQGGPLRRSPFCYGLPGAIPPAYEFDPAGLTRGRTRLEVYRLREAELVHGRVGMLASVGFMVQEKFHPIFPSAPDRALDHMPILPAQAWIALTVAVGVAEATRIQRGWANPYESMANVQRLKDDYYPGDLGFDPLRMYPASEQGRRYMQTCELSHGRLAMLASAGFLAQETVTGEPWAQADSHAIMYCVGKYAHLAFERSPVLAALASAWLL